MDVGQTFCVPDLSGTRGQNAEKILFFCKNVVGNLYGGRILVCDVTLCVQEKRNQGQKSSISPISDGFTQVGPTRDTCCSVSQIHKIYCTYLTWTAIG